ncbi:hypothetical protein [Amphritea sp. HPY]|uniref:hypothetical protein n=1 Tax=Amphritea sp. HPY TaxID=3421652 RepID=UPI003D7EE0C9
MKTLISTIALTSALVAGSAVAAGSVQLEQLGGGTAIDSHSHFSGKELVMTDGANIPRGHFGEDLYSGSK